jgi:hypothetical protein
MGHSLTFTDVCFLVGLLGCAYLLQALLPEGTWNPLLYLRSFLLKFWRRLLQLPSDLR